MVHVRSRLWVEVMLGAASVGLLIITAAWPDWIEAVFGFDPDGGNGALEWAIVLILGVSVVTLPLMAGNEWRRTRAGDFTPGS